ncbi:MAG TPA: hypothetical protein VHM20_06735 [Gammaproteobacteria bacterium]|jgi:hypothetical protein|nr:hypothetical protein [Gammaproteobacteria bacterium]
MMFRKLKQKMQDKLKGSNENKVAFGPVNAKGNVKAAIKGCPKAGEKFFDTIFSNELNQSYIRLQSEEVFKLALECKNQNAIKALLNLNINLAELDRLYKEKGFSLLSEVYSKAPDCMALFVSKAQGIDWQYNILYGTESKNETQSRYQHGAIAFNKRNVTVLMDLAMDGDQKSVGMLVELLKNDVLNTANEKELEKMINCLNNAIISANPNLIDQDRDPYKAIRIQSIRKILMDVLQKTVNKLSEFQKARTMLIDGLNLFPSEITKNIVTGYLDETPSKTTLTRSGKK